MKKIYTHEELSTKDNEALIEIAKIIEVSKTTPQKLEGGILVLDRTELIRSILNMSDQERKRQKTSPKKILLTLGSVVAVITSIITGAYYFINIFPDKAELTPEGGIIDGKQMEFNNKYGYLSYENVNKRENLYDYLKENKHDVDLFRFGQFDRNSIDLSLTNKRTTELTIANLTFKVSNIKQINEPLLLIYEDKENRTMSIENHGWADAKDVAVTVNDDLLKEYILDYPFTVEFGTIKYKEKVLRTFLNNDMLIQQNLPKDYGREFPLNGILSYTGVNKKTFESEVFLGNFMLDSEGIEQFPYQSGTWEWEGELGVFFSADNGEYETRKDFYTYLEPGQAIPLSVKLFTNRSCTFDVEIEATVNYSDTIITLAKLTGVELFVSSIDEPYLFDGELLD